jgi:dihydroorotate dehydrogenase
MYSILKQLLFVFPPERAHSLTTTLLKWVLNIPGARSLIQTLFVVRNDKLHRKVMGLHFENPVGLAAGFDKNAAHLHEFKSFGFGFIEIGTVTPKSQPGNPKPRLFRLKKDEALINRMGFNNDGLEAVISKLRKRPQNLIIGGNIGKNKITPNEEATQDYLKCFKALFDHVDYFVVNVSSPNTPDLRQLQDKEPLTSLLSELQHENNSKENPKPILLKIAPDLNNDQLDDIIEIVSKTGLSGIIATNTTISREGLMEDESSVNSIGAGGLSGAPLRKRSTEIIRYIREKDQNMTIIGVGGITDAESALEKMKAGADLVQLYTGFIYKGPGLTTQINKALLNVLEEA